MSATPPSVPLPVNNPLRKVKLFDMVVLIGLPAAIGYASYKLSTGYAERKAGEIQEVRFDSIKKLRSDQKIKKEDPKRYKDIHDQNQAFVTKLITETTGKSPSPPPSQPSQKP